MKAKLMTDTASEADFSQLSEKERRLELNRAAAMRSRMKKKHELERLQQEAEVLTAANDAAEKRFQQFEVLLQESYKANTLLQAQLLQALNTQAEASQRLKSLHDTV
jgi:hypothetical protein